MKNSKKPAPFEDFYLFVRLFVFSWLSVLDHHSMVRGMDTYKNEAVQYFHSAVNGSFLHYYLRPLQFYYLSYELQRQEMSHFGIKKKVEKCGFSY